MSASDLLHELEHKRFGRVLFAVVFFWRHQPEAKPEEASLESQRIYPCLFMLSIFGEIIPYTVSNLDSTARSAKWSWEKARKVVMGRVASWLRAFISHLV